MQNHKIIDVHVWRQYPTQDKPTEIKTLSIILFDKEEGLHHEKAVDKLSSLYNWKEGFHYDSLTFENSIKNNSKTTEMAIKKTKTTEEVENKTSEKSNEVAVFTEETTKSINLPEIPDVINIGGVEFSKDLIEKEVNEVKQILLTKPDNSDTLEVVNERNRLYDILKDKKGKFVKTRTVPEKMRAEAVKPINEWTRKLKEKTDSFGALAKKGEEHCATQMAIVDSWIEEQDRIKKEAIQTRVKERSQQLSDINGVKNFDSGHWTFSYALHIIIEQEDLENEFGWDDKISEVSEAYSAYSKKQQEEKERSKATIDALFSARVTILEMMDYSHNPNDSFSKNGHTISKEDISSIADADFKELLKTHNTPALKTPFGSGASPFGKPVQDNRSHIETESTTAAPVNSFAKFLNKSEDSTPINIDQGSDDQQSQAEPTGLQTTWVGSFSTSEMPNTVLIVGPFEQRDDMLASVPQGKEVMYNQEMTIGLWFIIYKK